MWECPCREGSSHTLGCSETFQYSGVKFYPKTKLASAATIFSVSAFLFQTYFSLKFISCNYFWLSEFLKQQEVQHKFWPIILRESKRLSDLRTYRHTLMITCSKETIRVLSENHFICIKGFYCHLVLITTLFMRYSSYTGLFVENLQPFFVQGPTFHSQE